MRFNKILIANRGEIACRVISSAKAQGYQTVAVYSEADADARHVQMADESVCIGPATVSASYLNMDNILAAIQQTGAGAVHPGYGFLSENAQFAQRCEDAGVVFIGPTPSAIDLMGSKRQSKIAMIQAGVPCVPGYEGDDQSDTTLLAQAKQIGFPLMIKASAGGGGRGMRIVHEASEVAEALSSARSESLNAFGSDELILEKAIMQPRHIEIQVFADEHGNTVYLGERDCSLQRRHQKVVEEAPSPFVSEALRKEMGEAAVAAAKACEYRGAGTVEFLADKDGGFYFLEMNTRLQVEHPVTELVTGRDLVALQLQVAQGEELGFDQSDVTLTGHAIEVRLYAEDPAQDFMPQTGTILAWQTDDSLRNDHGIVAGQTISAHYDPMIAKLISYGENRNQAIEKLRRGLAETTLLGVKHNAAFLSQLLHTNVFRQGDATTQYIEQEFLSEFKTEFDPHVAVMAAITQYHLNVLSDEVRKGWSSAVPIVWPIDLVLDEKTYRARVSDLGAALTVVLDGVTYRCDGVSLKENRLRCLINDTAYNAHVCIDQQSIWVSNQRGSYCFDHLTHQRTDSANDADGDALIRSKINGAVVALNVSEGQTVKKGDVLVVIEAMKMEHPYKAAADGVVKAVKVNVGHQVKPKQLLVELDT